MWLPRRMRLADWRKKHGKTLGDAAAMVGIGGNNPARAFQRYETGERCPPAVLIEAIKIATDGNVTPMDMHETRLAWERHNAGQSEEAAHG